MRAEALDSGVVAGLGWWLWCCATHRCCLGDCATSLDCILCTTGRNESIQNAYIQWEVEIEHISQSHAEVQIWSCSLGAASLSPPIPHDVRPT